MEKEMEHDMDIGILLRIFGLYGDNEKNMEATTLFTSGILEKGNLLYRLNKPAGTPL